ncbi:unnamed protein product [Nyctereutes procyonoides]|uniref:(raccoon dog) hypothetical protein n=1 Tax=Nyctereutes procyonoides TaxID=34880 RepID=A0A811ZDH6_NYCPR|nr:unnamed protein product [Nyctereutes procyonoides]
MPGAIMNITGSSGHGLPGALSFTGSSPALRGRALSHVPCPVSDSNHHVSPPSPVCSNPAEFTRGSPAGVYPRNHEGRKHLGPSHKAQDGPLSIAGVFFSENPAGISSAPAPEASLLTWELKCPIQKLKTCCLFLNPPRALPPRALGSWEKVSILLFTQACCGLAVCGQRLCIHW